jgi:hypothetical protein
MKGRGLCFPDGPWTLIKKEPGRVNPATGVPGAAAAAAAAPPSFLPQRRNISLPVHVLAQSNHTDHQPQRPPTQRPDQTRPAGGMNGGVRAGGKQLTSESDGRDPRPTIAMPVQKPASQFVELLCRPHPQGRTRYLPFLPPTPRPARTSRRNSSVEGPASIHLPSSPIISSPTQSTHLSFGFTHSTWQANFSESLSKKADSSVGVGGGKRPCQAKKARRTPWS